MLIGVAGRKRSGKDEVARILERDHGFKVVRLAGPLKAMLAALYHECGVDEDIIIRKIEGDLKERPCPYLCGRTPRFAMQTIGTEWGRACIDESFWIRTLTARINESDMWVVPDVRYFNECEGVQDAGGLVVRIDASERVEADVHSEHASEQDIDLLPADFEINNNGTLFELRHAVEAMLERIRET